MTRREKGRRPSRRVPEGPLNLIHRSKVPNPVLARAAARSYSLEWGVSQAVIDAAFSIAIRLQQGGYERTT